MSDPAGNLPSATVRAPVLPGVTRGIGAADYDNADAIVLWGHNPTRTWLAQATRIAQARKRGATVAVVDPKRGGAGETQRREGENLQRGNPCRSRANSASPTTGFPTR